jgi:hypothetical protein
MSFAALLASRFEVVIVTFLFGCTRTDLLVTTENLVSQIGFSSAVVAVPVTAFSAQSLILRYVAPRSTCAIVMIYALFDWLLDLIDGVEIRDFWHWLTLQGGIVLQTITYMQMRTPFHIDPRQ